ncbi:MAG: RNA methyltransferase, partial [Acidobacteria bacterium]|nr:RNA methyltransferase [Acidobacteriota bacterium]
MPRAETIASAANPLLKDIRRAVARGGLTAEGLLVAESFHLLEEALRSDCEVKTVLAAESVRGTVEGHIKRLAGIRFAVLPEALFQGISSTGTSQGVIALVRPPTWNLDQLFRGNSLLVALDGLQDPGNAGAISRAAEAFGASGILFLKATVSPFNAKTLRASAGSLFRLPFIAGIDPDLARAAFAQHTLDVYAAVPARQDEPSRRLDEVDLTRRCAIIIGSEAHGVRTELRAAALDISK